MVDLMSKICIPLEQERDINANHIQNAHHGDPDQSSPESHEGEDAVIEGQAMLFSAISHVVQCDAVSLCLHGKFGQRGCCMEE